MPQLVGSKYNGKVSQYFFNSLSCHFNFDTRRRQPLFSVLFDFSMTVETNPLTKFYQWAGHKAESSETWISKSTLTFIKVPIFGVWMYCCYLLFTGTFVSIHGRQPIHAKVKVGAVCNDGWESSSTGSGTCSNHGGVDHYVFSNMFVSHNFNESSFYFDQLTIVVCGMVFLSLMSRWVFYTSLSQIGLTFYLSLLLLFLPFTLLYFGSKLGSR